MNFGNDHAEKQKGKRTSGFSSLFNVMQPANKESSVSGGMWTTR